MWLGIGNVKLDQTQEVSAGSKEKTLKGRFESKCLGRTCIIFTTCCMMGGAGGADCSTAAPMVTRSSLLSLNIQVQTAPSLFIFLTRLYFISSVLKFNI